tara:strand:- start:480 stop:827 length:348 start_codon:yes stop_codon:yes gene_type:complete
MKQLTKTKLYEIVKEHLGNQAPSPPPPETLSLQEQPPSPDGPSGYDIYDQEGNKVGQLHPTSQQGSELWGRPLPNLERYGSEPMEQLHTFLKSRAGQKWYGWGGLMSRRTSRDLA